MRDRADIVVVGAGIMGLAIAYNLAKLGKTDILVLDRSYLCGGASGRNGGGVSQCHCAGARGRLRGESVPADDGR